MSDSLLVGASGVNAAQQMLDVVGNNLANANTTAFKAQAILFSDLVYQDLSAAANGPLAQVLTSGQPFTSGGAAATGGTTLDSLDGLQNPYAPGDQLRLQGITAGGTPVNVTIPVDDTTTLGDLVTAIDTNF